MQAINRIATWEHWDLTDNADRRLAFAEVTEDTFAAEAGITAEVDTIRGTVSLGQVASFYFHTEEVGGVAGKDC